MARPMPRLPPVTSAVFSPTSDLQSGPQDGPGDPQGIDEGPVVARRPSVGEAQLDRSRDDAKAATGRPHDDRALGVESPLRESRCLDHSTIVEAEAALDVGHAKAGDPGDGP